MVHHADMLVAGMNLNIPDNLVRYIKNGIDTTCAITGEHITVGVPTVRVIPSSTGEYLDLLHGNTMPYISINAATAYKGSWNLGSRLIFANGEAFHPLISRQSAQKQNRMCWSDLVRIVGSKYLGRDETILAILATDVKKKVWPKSRVGVLGTHTPILVYDPSRCILQNVYVDWYLLIETLCFVEKVYKAGFNKFAISESLYSDYARFVADLELHALWEHTLCETRETPEFLVSIIIAQKEEQK